MKSIMHWEKMVKVEMLKNGIVVGSGKGDNVDIATNDAIRDCYVYSDHGLTWDDFCDIVDAGYYRFEITD